MKVYQPFLVALFWLAPAEPVSPPILRIEAQEITIQGTTPGGDVAVVGAARFAANGIAIRWHDAASLPDGDFDGRTVWRQSWPIPPRAVWAAVDVATGASDLASDLVPGLRPNERSLALPAGLLANSTFGFRLVLPAGAYQVLLVRPGRGAWRGTPAQIPSGVRAELAPLAFESVGPTQVPLNAFEPGDVLIVVELDRLQIAARTLHAADFGGGNP